MKNNYEPIEQTTELIEDILAEAVPTTDDPYLNSPFFELKQCSSRTKGALIEKIVERFYVSNGNEVLPANSSNYDRIIDGKRVEITGSFLWKDVCDFRWQQIRPAEDFDAIVFVAIYPDVIEIYVADKIAVAGYVLQQDKGGNFPYNQHGGKQVNSGTFFLQGQPEDFQFMTLVGEIHGN